MERNNDNWKEITENNKLIAEFMDYKYIPYNENLNSNHAGYWKNGKVFGINSLQYTLNPSLYLCRKHRDLKYHSDWNWLMEVVEKISKEKYVYIDITPLTLNPEKLSYCYIEKSFLRPSYSKTIKNKCLKIAVYQSVVEFIKWYNGNK